MNRIIAAERFTFPPQLRLRKPADYKKVFANPIRQTDKYFTLLAIGNSFDYSRLGLAISKKNIKKAVARNKIKRLARESFRLHRSRLGDLDIVVLARREAAEAPSEILRHSLERHWLKLINRCASYS